MSQSEYITNERLDAMISIQEGIAEDADKENGTVHTLDTDILSALKELKEYRDIGPTPEQLKEIDRLYLEKCREVGGMKRQMTWTPASEMPEDMKTVLVWFVYFRYGDYNRPYQTYGLGYVYRGEWSGFVNSQSGWTNLKILAWMPLPERYEETVK